MRKSFIDQLGNKMEISFPPQRIISLVPSQTELLFDLGLENEVVGITRFCIHPLEKCKSKIKIGGTKKIDIKKIIELNPDLIIANKEENNKEEIEEIQKKFPVWVSDINNLNGALEMINSIGEMTNKVSEANEIVNKIKSSFENFNSPKYYSVAYLIWRNPYMTVGSDTFINDMLSCAGYKNVFSDYKRYPIIGLVEMRQANPDFIFLSSEPYPFLERHTEEFQEIFPNAKIILVDGEYFSWYGSRLLGAREYFKALSLKLKA